jgi:hypothetical protein
MKASAAKILPAAAKKPKKRKNAAEIQILRLERLLNLFLQSLRQNLLLQRMIWLICSIFRLRPLNNHSQPRSPLNPPMIGLILVKIAMKLLDPLKTIGALALPPRPRNNHQPLKTYGVRPPPNSNLNIRFINPNSHNSLRNSLGACLTLQSSNTRHSHTMATHPLNNSLNNLNNLLSLKRNLSSPPNRNPAVILLPICSPTRQFLLRIRNPRKRLPNTVRQRLLLVVQRILLRLLGLLVDKQARQHRLREWQIRSLRRQADSRSNRSSRRLGMGFLNSNSSIILKDNLDIINNHSKAGIGRSSSKAGEGNSRMDSLDMAVA